MSCNRASHTTITVAFYRDQTLILTWTLEPRYTYYRSKHGLAGDDQRIRCYELNMWLYRYRNQTECCS